MKKTLLLTGLLLATMVSVALAGGVNFNWGTVCYTDNPVSAKVFACNTNGSAGNAFLTASFKVDHEIPDFVGVEISMEGQSDAAALPDYWKVGVAPDCRAGKALFIAGFGTVASDACLDWFGASTLLVYAYTWDGNRAHVDAAAAIPADVPIVLPIDTEYYAGQLQVLNSKAVGTGACTGCSIGMIWGLKQVVAAGLGVEPNPGMREVLTEPMPGGNHCLIWNNSALPCAAPVPARNTTWGQVKSLYR
jgi:hypothetical protein